MSSSAASVYLLPPRPALRDWPLAGACAGLLLGLAELLLATPLGSPPPRLALLSLTSLALALALGAAGIGLVLRGLRARPSQSALVASLTGLMALAALTPIVLPLPGSAAWLGPVSFALAAGVALAAALAAARLADRFERAGTPASALPCWGAVALLVAAGERFAQPPASPAALLLLAAVALGAAGGFCAAAALARRRGPRRPPPALGRLLVGLGALAFAAAYAPALLPWLLAGRDLPEAAGVPASILVAALGASSSAAETSQTGALAGGAAIAYAPLVPEPTRAIEALLTLPDGHALVPALAGAGYATAAILADPALAQDAGAAYVDARPGTRARLERELAWLALAPWLTGPGQSLLERLELGDRMRPPEQLGAEAARWLLRRSAAPTPFFLLVDFRRRESAGALEHEHALEAAAALLEHLDQLGLAQRTVVLLARAGAAGEPPLLVTLRPPLAWSQDATGDARLRRIGAGELAELLERIGRSDGIAPVRLPGVAWTPPIAPTGEAPAAGSQDRG